MVVRTIDDRWLIRERVNGKRTGRLVRSARYGEVTRWRARYSDPSGREFTKAFETKAAAKKWLASVSAAIVRDDYVDPKTAKITVGEWSEIWLAGYGTRKPSTVRQARVHCKHIVAEFGPVRVRDVRPSHVKAWTAKLAKSGMATSTVYAVYRRFVQLMGDAVADGIIMRSPCSRKTSPPQARQRPFVATDEQVWALHDVMPEHLRPAVLLGAFAGLRVSEAAALLVADVDFSGLTLTPSGDLKTQTSGNPVAISASLAARLREHIETYGGETVVTDELGGHSSSWAIERAIRARRTKVPGLPDGFRFHDLRHYFGSTLLAEGCSVKVVQSQMRHASATTTLNTYGHLLPDGNEKARAAIDKAMTARGDSDGTEAVA